MRFTQTNYVLQRMTTQRSLASYRSIILYTTVLGACARKASISCCQRSCMHGLSMLSSACHDCMRFSVSMQWSNGTDHMCHSCSIFKCLCFKDCLACLFAPQSPWSKCWSYTSAHGLPQPVLSISLCGKEVSHALRAHELQSSARWLTNKCCNACCLNGACLAAACK